MDLSIIIAHYDPGNHSNCLESFHKTLLQIESQKDNYEIEIIIADDGSITNDKIKNIATTKLVEGTKIIYCLDNEELNVWKKRGGYNYPSIKQWLYLPKTKPTMSKARIANLAISQATSDNLFFLDDDNYFISDHTIDTIINLLKNYQLVIGQIQDKNGRLRPFSSNRVQGTTFGITKTHIIKAGLFGKWTEAVSCGVDSDIWWKLYQYYCNNSHLKACYTSDIRTIDSCSKRWKPFIKTFFRKRQLKKAFYKEHNCPDYNNPKYNPSRDKKYWIVNLLK